MPLHHHLPSSLKFLNPKVPSQHTAQLYKIHPAPRIGPTRFALTSPTENLMAYSLPLLHSDNGLSNPSMHQQSHQPIFPPLPVRAGSCCTSTSSPSVPR